MSDIYIYIWTVNTEMKHKNVSLSCVIEIVTSLVIFKCSKCKIMMLLWIVFKLYITSYHKSSTVSDRKWSLCAKYSLRRISAYLE